MPWFQNSKDKEFRLLIEGKMDICLNKPDKYDQAFPVLDSLVKKPNQKAIEMIVDHIKQVIKDQDLSPLQKLQAIKLLRDLMQSQSKPLGKYVVKKILKRLTVFAQHRKNQKGEERGANIFKCKKSQQKYGIEFLKIVLQCLSDWGQNWPRNADGPFHDFHSAFNDLLMEKQVEFPRDVKKANKSPVPKGGFRNSRPQQSPPKVPEKKIQNPLTKLSVPKQRKPLKKPQAQYINEMVQMLGLLSEALKQNQEFNQNWMIIKAYAQNFKTVDEKGNFLVCQLIESGERNQQLEKAIQNNANFIAGLNKNINIVEKKNQIYPKFNKEYITICNNMVASLSRFNQKSSASSFANNNNASTSALKPPIQTSINDKIQQMRPKERPLAQAGDNRYGSSNQLRNQLELNLKIRKEDFNSGTLSRNNQNSQRGIQTSNPNRNSMTQFNQSKERQVSGFFQQKKTINEPKRKSVQEEKQQEFNKLPQQKQKKLKEISKITQKNQNDSEHNFSKFEISKQTSRKQIQKQKQKIDGSFGQFQMPNPNAEKSDSNSNFFKQIQNKTDIKQFADLRRNRKAPKKQENNDFFNDEVKSKGSVEGFSGFQKSKEKSNEQGISQNRQEKSAAQRNSIQEYSNPKGFDTFKSPNQISRGMEEIRQSKKSRKSQISNPLDEKRSFQADKNFFGDSSFNKQLQKGNPFQFNQLQRIQPKKNMENPFATIDDGNPFKTQVRNSFRSSKDWNDSQSKSKASNPFSQKNSDEKSSKMAKPPIPRQKTERTQGAGGNPFQTISHASKRERKGENPFQTQNPFGNSFISNNSQKKDRKLSVLNEKSNQKSLSQRDSFQDPKTLQVASIKNQSSIIKNPFQILPGVGQNSKINQNQKNKNNVEQIRKQFSGFDFNDFMDKSQSKSGRSSQVGNIPQKQNLQKSNFSGFGFDAFGNVQISKNNSVESKQSKRMEKKVQTNKVHQISQQSKDSFDFFKQQNTKNKPEKNDFFNSKVLEQTQKKRQSNESKANQKSKNEQPSKKSFGQFNFQDFNNIEKSSSLNPFGDNSQQNKSSQQYGFDDFKNINQQSSSVKNPFSIEQKQKSKQQPSNSNLEISKPEIRVKSNQSEQLWKKFEKPELNQSDEWKKFAEYKQNKSSKQPSIHNNQIGVNQTKSQYEPSVDNDELKDEANLQPYKPIQIYSRRQSPHFQKEPYFGEEKSLSLQFQDTSPFQKKYIPWSYTLADLPSSARYNITEQNVRAKKQVLNKLEVENRLRLQKYCQVNQMLNEVKKSYTGYLDKLGQVREQKRQFKIILKRLEEANEVKQREIEELIKKKKRAEQIKRKILQNERILYERMKTDKRFRESQTNTKQKTVNKWDRFNKNLQKQRDMVQQQKTVSNFSYYV